MLIYNGIITLDYNPATDVLVTSMPDARRFGLSEASMCLGIIVSNVRNYDIKKLLLDFSKTVIEVEDEAYKAVVGKFAMGLMGTRLQKMARVGTTDKKREETTLKVAGELRQELNPPVALRISPQRRTQWHGCWRNKPCIRPSKRFPETLPPVLQTPPTRP